MGCHRLLLDAAKDSGREQDRSRHAHQPLAGASLARRAGRDNTPPLRGSITALARVLNSATIADGVAVESTNPKTPVHAMVKRQGGATYVFSAAMYGEETKATFRVQGLTGNRTAEVLGEDRQVRVQNGVFTEAFAGHGVHLYRIAEE